MRIKEIYLLFIISSPLYANSLNGIAINERLSSHQTFNFFVTGHMYGIANKETPFPSGTILANIENINARGGLFFASLGDIYDVQNKTSVANFKKSFLSKMNIPVYNAVGNHDVVDRKMYLNAFNLDSTFYYLKHKNNLFIFLDTELNNGKIVGKQKEFMQNVLLNESNSVKNIFIFMHRVFWKRNHNSMLPFRMAPRKVEFDPNNEISELVNELTTHNNSVHVFSGDVAQEHLLPLMYHRDKHVHYMAIGNSDSTSDALLNIKIDDVNEVEVEVISLVDGKKMKDYKEYEIDKNNYFMTSLKDMSFIEKIFYFLKYPYHSALLFSILIFTLGYKLRAYRG